MERDDRPFGRPRAAGCGPLLLPDRSGAHAETWLGDFHGLVQAETFPRFGRLYEPGRKPGPLREATSWAHNRQRGG